MSNDSIRVFNPTCVKDENREYIVDKVKAFFIENLNKKTPDGASGNQGDGKQNETRFKVKDLNTLLKFRFKISKEAVFTDNIKFKQFKRDFMNQIVDCLYYNNDERNGIEHEQFKTKYGDIADITEDVERNNITFELITHGLNYKFKNNNLLVERYRDKMMQRFIKTIEKQLENDSISYPKLKGEDAGKLLTKPKFIEKGLYNLILRLTCAMYFTVLHGSNFIDYDILSIAQYKLIMDKLWLNKWTVNSKVKPNTLIDMLSINENYWQEMCEIERESFMRNRLAFFYDYVDKDVYYRDFGLDPGLRRRGLSGTKSVIPAEKLEALYSTRDSRWGDSPIYSANKLQLLYRGMGNTGNGRLDDDDSDDDDDEAQNGSSGNQSSIKKKNIYCAEIDDSYVPIDFNERNKEDYKTKRAEYYHIYDDISVPHLSSGTTWKYIDDEEHRVDVNESTNDKEHKTNANIRFILLQDQINFVKYFVNLKIIPIYDYFDTFMDGFCMLASKIVADENYEIVRDLKDTNNSEADYTSVNVLNFKAFYKILENDNTANPSKEFSKRVSERISEQFSKNKTEENETEENETEENFTKEDDNQKDTSQLVIDGINNLKQQANNVLENIGKKIKKEITVLTTQQCKTQRRDFSDKINEDDNLDDELVKILRPITKGSSQEINHTIQIYSEIKDELKTLSDKPLVELSELNKILPSIRQTYGDGNCLYHAIAQCGRIDGKVLDKDKNEHKIYKVSYDQNTMKNIDKIYKDQYLGSHNIVESKGPVAASSLQFRLLMNKIKENSDSVSDEEKLGFPKKTKNSKKN